MFKFGKGDNSKQMPELVSKYLIAKGLDKGWVNHLKAVSRSRSGDKAMDVRIFDGTEAAEKKVDIKDYASLDGYRDLILYEGAFDTESSKVDLVDKAKPASSQDETIFTHGQIWQAIVHLTKPGSTVFFFLGASPASGGPLTRGAAVIELNPEFPGNKQKKYNIYTVDVDGIKPKGKGQKLWDSDEAMKIADWIKERHHKPMYDYR